MNVDKSRAQELVQRPIESLSVEIKRWINLETNEGIAKIVKTVLALRNHGGGYMMIGFDDVTLLPDKTNIPQDVRTDFHIDKIQGMLSRFSSEPFEVSVEFPEREGRTYPVIVVPPGVKTPVATKSELISEGRTLIAPNSIYVRSLRSNNTPSTTIATWKDWSNILDVCFENREADIGRFLRRHVGGISPDIVLEFISAISKGLKPKQTTEELLEKCLQKGRERYWTITKERNLELPAHGTWEVALIFIGKIPPHSPDQKFLNLLDSCNPNYTGWPVWLDSRAFVDKSARPYVSEGSWEALIINNGSGWNNQIDFMRIDPLGHFYLLRGLEDDVSGSPNRPTAMTELDFALPVFRTTEAIAVGTAFAKAMGCDLESTNLAFAFKWTGLKGRILTSWANPRRYISSGRTAYQDDVLSFVFVPLETPLSAITEYVMQSVKPLFEVFNGFDLSKEVLEDMTRSLIERRL